MRDEIKYALKAIMDGYKAEFTDGYIVVENPDASPEAIALGDVNPNLVINLQELYRRLS